ncbi:tubulin-tyrosine ligase family protein [Sarocladium implicatum]|nr:tubulin-tyrosine ligase family protein [Sarocladium implicatum]
MHVFVKSANEWLDPFIRQTIQRHIPDAVFHDDFADFPDDAQQTIQICNGWHLNPHFVALNKSHKGVLNAYPSSDGVSRKDHLARVIEYWTTKRPESKLRNHWPLTVRLSLDYSEYVDESLSAADDLSLLYSLEENEAKEPADREWWILKPALIDCGAGIRIFSTIKDLEDCLELAESDDEGEDEEHADDKRDPVINLSRPGLDTLDGLVTATGKLKIDESQPSQKWLTDETQRIPSASMRQFVAQRYIVSIPPIEGRKWHVRAYVMSLGRLKVYVYKDLLALLAVDEYRPPWTNPGLKSSLTNTSLQDADEVVEMESMRSWDALPEDTLSGDWKADVFQQICDISGEVLQAAAHTVGDKFTPLEKCFELFAVDFLVDSNGTAWLLEVNETPAFYESGVAGPLSKAVMESVVSLAMNHMGYQGSRDEEVARSRMVQVLDETEKLGKSNISVIVPE